MSSHDIDVSFVMTVYNKEYYLPSVLKALLNQSGVKNPEYIFVDDVSTDHSVEIIREATKGLPNVQIVVNEKNCGISRNTNKAIALAHGEYTRLLDSDDIFPLDSTEILMDLAKSNHADMVYGCFTKTGEEPEELTNRKTGDFTYKYYPDALDGVLHNRFIRMGQLIKTSVLQASGGADERVFIQDESLPLRVAMKAHGAIKMSANVVLVPKEKGNFSGNKIQLDNDRFMAYYFALADNRDTLPEDKKALMYKRAVSAYWKMVKKTHRFPYLHWGFGKYLYVRLFKPQPHFYTLQKMYGRFMGLENIRR